MGVWITLNIHAKNRREPFPVLQKIGRNLAFLFEAINWLQLQNKTENEDVTTKLFSDPFPARKLP
jgi:hypothetical protein